MILNIHVNKDRKKVTYSYKLADKMCFDEFIAFKWEWERQMVETYWNSDSDFCALVSTKSFTPISI